MSAKKHTTGFRSNMPAYEITPLGIAMVEAAQAAREREKFDRHYSRVARRWRKRGTAPALFFGSDYNRG